jgi:hypothetical protein
MHSDATNKLHRFLATLRMTGIEFIRGNRRESVAGWNL